MTGAPDEQARQDQEFARKSISDLSGQRRTQGVHVHERRGDQTELFIVEVKFRLQHGRHGVDRHSVGVVEEADKPEHADDPPFVGRARDGPSTKPASDSSRLTEDTSDVGNACSSGASAEEGDSPMSKVRRSRSSTTAAVRRNRRQASRPIPKSWASSSITSACVGDLRCSPRTTSGAAWRLRSPCRCFPDRRPGSSS